MLFAINLFMLVQINESKAQTGTLIDSLFQPVHFLDFSVDRVIPLGTFKESLDKNLWGFSLAYLKQRESENVDYFGIQFDYAHIGNLSTVFFDTDVKTGTNHFSLHLLYRRYSSFYYKSFEPFMEVALGPQAFYTVTTTTFLNDQTNDIDFDRFDMGLSYGLNVGFTVQWYQQLFFMFKMGYYGGTSITYLVGDESVPTGGLPLNAFFPETSSVNRLRFNVGVALRL